jgi:hypothetical protein
MIGSLRAEVKRMLDKAFAPPRPCLATFLHDVIDTLVSPSDEIIPINQKLKGKQRSELNALLKRQSELEGPAVIHRTIIRAFEACFVLVDFVRLQGATDIRLFDMQRLLCKYPQVACVDDDEAHALLVYRNVMMTALLSIAAVLHKDMLIDICVRFSEGAGAATKYSRGGGTQTDGTDHREDIYAIESGIAPKPCRVERTAREASALDMLFTRSNKKAVAKDRPCVVSGVPAIHRKLPRTAKSAIPSKAMKANAAKRQRVDSRPDAPDHSASDQRVQLTISTSEIEFVFRSFQVEPFLGDDEELRDLNSVESCWMGAVSQCPEHCELESNGPHDAALHTSCVALEQSAAAIECDPCNDETQFGEELWEMGRSDGHFGAIVA